MNQKNQDNTLPVMEAFYTIQGEGSFQGKAAYFIRLGGCDVGCHWCDVKESWDVDDHPNIDVQEIVDNAKKHPAKLAVVTGGEPLMYKLDQLTEKLQAEGIATNLETSGAYPLSGKWDWICLSPKKFKLPTDDNYQNANELKMVIYNQSDFKWAEEQRKKVKSNCRLFLQPEWSKSKEIMPSIIEYVKNNPDWEISLQIHKFMDIP